MPTCLPNFDANGNLPPGDYRPGEAEFVERFVHVAGSATRQGIYSGYLRHRADLTSAGVDATAPCILNGSYITNKADPGDLDLVVEVDASAFGASSALQALLSGPKAKPTFQCDAYPLPVLPADHPHYAAVTLKARSYWKKWFAQDRAGNAKGLVWTTVGGFS